VNDPAAGALLSLEIDRLDPFFFDSAVWQKSGD